MEQWYRLDNAAKLFPAVSNRKNTSVFRVSAVLHEEIDGQLLQRATDHIYSRFPMLFVRLHSGVFWNYLDDNERGLQVREDTSYPCAMIKPRENDGYMLRILYAHKRISLECFHTLTDGGGAFEFMKSLIYYYLSFSGKEINPENQLLTAGEGANLDEMEDSYQRYYQKQPPNPQAKQAAYRIKGTSFRQYGANVTTGIMSAKALNTLAKSQGATITSYLAAALIHAILETHPNSRKDDRPIAVTVPVNLRKAFPSETLRNFFGVVNLRYIQQGRPDFADTLASMTSQLRQATSKEHLQTVIAQNVALERNIASRFVPLLLKRPFIALGFAMFGEREKTITLSNLGNIVLPSDMAQYVDRFEVFSYTSSRNPMICAVCSVDDKLAISFSRTIIEPNIIRRFFMFLANEGKLDVTVYSNNWGA